MKTITIIYKVLNHKKINGTLFYCFEYFLYLQDILLESNTNTNININLILYNETDRKFYDFLFEKYSYYNIKSYKNLKTVNKIKDLYKYKDSDIILYLDTRSFESTKAFFKNSKILFFCSNVNDFRNLKAINFNNVKVFGFYDYQQIPLKNVKTIKENLRFYFDIFPKIEKSENKTFVSSPNTLPKNIEENLKDYFTKRKSENIPNLFEKFNKFLYYHDSIDTNNRLIIEAIFYNKKIEIIEPKIIKDSIHIRNKEFQKKGKDMLLDYKLSKNDKIIESIINNT